MTDLNLNGLPALEALFVRAELVNDEFARRAVDELRRLVERERIGQARGDLAEINRAAERLPAWAKPVMRAVRDWMGSEYNSEEEGCAISDMIESWDNLTEAQLKEIGEDDG